jgi:hypothetical protein
LWCSSTIWKGRASAQVTAGCTGVGSCGYRVIQAHIQYDTI